jgi:hypothetical protein
MAKLGEGERQDRLAIKQKQAESIYAVLPAPKMKWGKIYVAVILDVFLEAKASM